MTPKRLIVHLTAACAVGSGVVDLLRRRRRRRGDFRVFLLEYHNVTAGQDEPEGTVAVARLHQHIQFLAGHFRLTTFAEAAARLAAPGGLTEDLAVVTFDDGYAGNYEAAWPILRTAGAPATVFVTSGFLDGRPLWFDVARRTLVALHHGRTALPATSCESLRAVFGAWPSREGVEALVRRMKYFEPARRARAMTALGHADPAVDDAARSLTWEQAKAMCDGGIELGGHTVSHPILSTLDPVAQEAEIIDGCERIAAMTGQQPTTFAFPNGAAGDFDNHTLDILRRHGFQAACTTLRGSNRPGCDPFTLKRTGIGSDPTYVLAARLAGLFDEGLRAWLPA